VAVGDGVDKDVAQLSLTKVLKGDLGKKGKERLR